MACWWNLLYQHLPIHHLHAWHPVLVIYYKQISGVYEDRRRFVILQKIGLGDLKVKQTDEILTVFFLPLILPLFALAFAYHMISLIVRIIGVLNPSLMLVIYYHSFMSVLQPISYLP